MCQAAPKVFMPTKKNVKKNSDLCGRNKVFVFVPPGQEENRPHRSLFSATKFGDAGLLGLWMESTDVWAGVVARRAVDTRKRNWLNVQGCAKVRA